MSKGLQRSINRGDQAKAGVLKKTFLASDLAISVVGATGVGFGSAILGDFPEGNIVFLGAVSYMTFAGGGADANLGDTWQGDYGIGTTPMSDATMSTGDEDLIVETAIAAATAEVSPRTKGIYLEADVGQMHDNTDGTLEINLNLLIDDADIGGTSPITVNGELTILYAVLGDD